MPSKKLLCIDAGGTFFKYGVYTPDGVCVSGIKETPSHSDGSKEEVLAVYRNLIESVLGEYPISAIGISTPGPFYYPSGTYKMKHKFQSLYDVSLIAELGDMTDAEWFFSSDTNAFLLGEYTPEISGQYRNVLGVTLGTGLGMSVISDGKLLKNKEGGVVERIFCVPFGDGIAEDVISSRGLRVAYDGKLTAKEIAFRADCGEEKARAVYRDFGKALAQVLAPYLEKYQAELIIFGGQIAKSMHLFSDAFSGIEIAHAKFGEEAALKGLCREYQTKYL